MNHKKKMIAPIIVVVIMGVYLAVMGVLYAIIPKIPILVKILLVGIPVASIAVLIGVLISRINEIRSGEEDDLSDY